MKTALKESFRDLKTLVRMLKKEKMRLISFSIQADGSVSASVAPDLTEELSRITPQLPNLDDLPKSFDQIPIDPGLGALRNWIDPNLYPNQTFSHDDLMKQQREADSDALGNDLFKYTGN